jgi:uncharacterized damage-inducible protein DinB
MEITDLIILNFEETRRRSIKVWKSIPGDVLHWKPDEKALSCAEMIRHILEGEFLYHQILKGKGSQALVNLVNPFEGREFLTVDVELDFAQSYRNDFLNYIKLLKKEDLAVDIDRSNVGYVRKLGDMLLRIAYHESVHTGQLLDYMRTMNVERPQIWD